MTRKTKIMAMFALTQRARASRTKWWDVRNTPANFKQHMSQELIRDQMDFWRNEYIEARQAWKEIATL